MEVNQETNTAAEVAPSEAQTTAPVDTTPQVTELDGLSEFTFQGQKYTPESFHKIFSEHKTFETQAQEYKREKEFSDNLQIDLDNVLERPELAQRFKATYPKKYHAILDRYLSSGGQAPVQSTPAQPSLPKEFLSEFSQLKEQVAHQAKREYEMAVQAASAKLDSVLPPLFKKYELANEKEVYGRAEALIGSGQNLTEKTWERIVRESHEQMEKKANQVYSAKLKKQTEVGQRGADSGPGGSAPGNAPVKPRTFAEAQEAMIASMKR